MPVLPGDAQPLELKVSSSTKKGPGKGTGKKAKAKKPGASDAPGTPKTRKRKGDEELLQLDLKRDQLNLRRHVEPWW